MTTGTERHAKTIAQWHVNRGHEFEVPAGFKELGEGAQRTAYLHIETGIVYKVGDDACNRYEHQTLAKLRGQGHEHAPVTTLYRVRVTDYSDCAFGCAPEVSDRDVIAMPYLPEDGSVPHAEVWLPGMVDLNPDNIHAHGGKLWLIDAGGI
jgi:hypothetical protein